MPFDSSYTDFDKHRYSDSQDLLAGIARRIVRDPLATHVIKTATPSGKTRYLVVDRARTPEEGSLVIAVTDCGLRLGRVRRAVSMKHIWGTVTWFLQEG
ncbi:MAG: hypothetical protein LBL73_08165 [Synergistaceae bacterium]|nr:hypothetical protein [Synergistaceae bacterium]